MKIELNAVKLGFFAVAPDDKVNAAVLIGGQDIAQIIGRVDRAAVGSDYLVADLKAVPAADSVVVKFGDGRGREHILRGDDYHGQHKTEQYIEHGARDDDEQPPPGLGFAESARVVAFFVLALHCAEAAERNKAQRILGLADLLFKQARAEADRELVYAYVVELGKQKMAELVNNDNDDKHKHSHKVRPDAIPYICYGLDTDQSFRFKCG